MTTKLTYTQQVAAFREEMAAGFADVMARLDALGKPVVQPPVTEPPAEDPPVVTPPVTAPVAALVRQLRDGPLRTIVRTPSDLISAKLVLPYAAENVRNPENYPTYARGPYGNGVGLTPGMGGTGERQEIGQITDAIGLWLCGGDPNNMLVQAESHATVPVHFRIDGKMVDITKYPRASSYNPPSQVGADPAFDKSGYDVAPEMAHYPNLEYAPYLATGDLWYLQELQDAATFALIWGNPAYRGFDKGAPLDNQPRGIAWTLNILASAYIATQEAEKAGSLPEPLLPSTYWKQVLDNNRDAFKRAWIDGADATFHFPLDQALHVIGDTAWVAPWEQDFVGFVLGWMIWTGRFDDWRENYEWHSQQALMRADLGDRAIGYHLFTSDTTTDWPSLVAANAASEDRSYRAYYRGNTKLMMLNGIAGADKAFALADSLAAGYVPYKWAV